MAAQEAVPIVAIGSQVEISLVGLEAWSTRSFSPTTSTSPDGPSSSKKSRCARRRPCLRSSRGPSAIPRGSGWSAYPAP
ncbi:hypothetical protein Zm00014a_004540 [Zea mays]|uniref:Uncharacterized protein n=1 Tax=Zea mays TaxID=4577 RepID=A0A3L6D7J5_MAIZE|nr:hypothetical protein Zm00014a_004540 [Zea mays]